MTNLTGDYAIYQIAQMEELIHDELSREIIGAAMHVLNKMKPGPGRKAV